MLQDVDFAFLCTRGCPPRQPESFNELVTFVQAEAMARNLFEATGQVVRLTVDNLKSLHRVWGESY